MKSIQVNEIFGPTIQGEGPFAGRSCIFIRLFGCNQECKWCDTAYTWAITPTKSAKTLSQKIYKKEDECHDMTVQQILDKLFAIRNLEAQPTLIVLSGGEPMMQQHTLEPLVGELNAMGCLVQIETAGTIPPLDSSLFEYPLVHYVVSPKLNNSGNAYKKRFKPYVLNVLRDNRAVFKFVISIDTVKSDFEEIDNIVDICNIDPSNVSIMPEGTKWFRQVIDARQLIDDILSRGYGLSIRQQVLIWGDKRGV